MLNENIRLIRKSKGLSQEELAIKLNVVRQTVSKWEKGLSVPDSDMLMSISEMLETPVSTLLGETIAETAPDDVKAISAKLEAINLQLAKQKAARRKAVNWACICLLSVTVIIFVVLYLLKSPYLSWNWSSAETAVIGTAVHAFEWAFFRAAPFLCVGSILGIILTRKRE